MKKNYFLPFIFSFMSLSGALWANNESAQQIETAAVSHKEEGIDRLFIATKQASRYWHFKNGTFVPQKLASLSLGLEHFNPGNYFWKFELGFQGGKAKTRAEPRWYDHEIEAQAQFGYSFAFAEDAFNLTPYSGLGYFYDNEPTYRTNHFKEHYAYIPVGVLATWDVNDTWRLGLNTQVNFILNRKLENNGTSYHTENEFTWLCELPLMYRFKEKFDVSLAPFFQYGSNVFYDNNGTREDWGLTKTWGAKIELGYRL